VTLSMSKGFFRGAKNGMSRHSQTLLIVSAANAKIVIVCQAQRMSLKGGFNAKIVIVCQTQRMSLKGGFLAPCCLQPRETFWHTFSHIK
jgi:hypothetical protein